MNVQKKGIWSRDFRSPKVLGLENWKSPGTMEILVQANLPETKSAQMALVSTFFKCL